MKYTFQALIVITQLISPSFAQSVSRSSSALPTLTKPFYGTKDVIGWAYTDEKQWVRGANRLPHENASDNKYSHDAYKFGYDNIQRLDSRYATIAGVQYLILMRYEKAGHYVYPNIREDWKQYDAITWYALPLETAEELSRTGITNKAIEFDTKNKYSGRIDSYIEAFSLERIQRDIQKATTLPQYEMYMNNKLYLRIFPVNDKGKDLVRFRFHTDRQSYDKFDPTIFDKRYYEIPLSSFISLFKPSPP